MSHSLLSRYIVLLTVSVYSRKCGVSYIIEISMTRSIKKVLLYLLFYANQNAYSFIINSTIIIHISDKRLYKKMKQYFQ